MTSQADSTSTSTSCLALPPGIDLLEPGYNVSAV
jgi:hypothetical protein